jgi:hypothetical protein
MNNCEVLNALGNYDFESRAFDAVSLVSSLAAKAKSRTSSFVLAYALYSANRKLTTVLDDFHDVLEGKKPAPEADTSITRERIVSTADNFEYCSRAIEYIYESARRARLTNNSITAGHLASLRKHGEEALDIANWLETVADSEYVKKVFDRAEKEKDSGEVYDLSQV